MDLTPALLNGVGVPALLVGLFWMLASGRLVTRREADGITKRAESAESARDTVLRQNTSLIDSNTVLIESTKPWRDLGNALISRGAE